jgi:hypothetical protein
MMLTSNRGFAECGEALGNTIVVTVLLDCLLHYAMVIKVEETSFRLSANAHVNLAHVSATTAIVPLPRKRYGRPPKKLHGVGHH